MTSHSNPPTLIIQFATIAGTVPTASPPRYAVRLDSQAVGQASSEMTLPHNPLTWRAVQLALEPNFDASTAPENVRQHLTPLGDLTRLKKTVGGLLCRTLLADPQVHSLFGRALSLAAADRQPLPVELRFGQDCDLLASLSWELIRYEDRFLVGDTSIALSRYPEGLLPSTPTLAELPLRVLLILSEPLDESPVFPQLARAELLHGLRRLDEEGAVIVDELKPPTFDTLVEAVRNGGYQMLIFYGHGGHGQDGGILLFEDEFGRGDPVPAAEVGAALRNTDVRLVLLGACKSASVSPIGPHPSPLPTRSAREREQSSPLPSPLPDDGWDQTSSPNVGEDRGGGYIWQGTAAALVKAGVPLVLGMQVSMRVDAAQAFLRQFALSLAAGKEVTEAVADARVPILRSTYGESWFIPALYGRPKDGQRLFDVTKPLSPANGKLRATMKAARSQIEQLEQAIGSVGVIGQGNEIADLRAARQRFVNARFELAQNSDGGYHQVISPLYGVPTQKLFVGRSDEMMAVGQALKQNNPVVIWGVGGLGKSALATEVVYRQNWRFPGGVLWLDCQNGPPFESLLERIAAFCGVADLNHVARQSLDAQDSAEESAATVEQKVAVVRSLLAQLADRCLLIWDNAEDVWGESRTRRLIQGQLPSNVQSLLTTRVDPDQTHWPTIEIRALADSPMQKLFLALAHAKGVKVGTQQDLDVVMPMLSWLQGHPLALELLIPLAHRRGLSRVWAELQRQPLKGVDAAFDISYQGLTRDQQRLFARLSVFMIAFEYTAAHALLPDSEAVDGDLDTLVQRALIHFDGSRYGYHALVRQFAYNRLQELEEDLTAIHGLAAQYLQDVGKERARRPDEALEEVDQWEKAQQWERMARRAGHLVHSLGQQGYWPEIEERLVSAQARVEQLADSQSLQATVLGERGIIAYKQARWGDAISYYEQSLQMKEQVGDIHGMAHTINNLGLAYQSKGEWDKAISYYEQSLQMKEQVGDIHGMAQTINNLGNTYQIKSEWDKAISYYEQSLQTMEQVGDIHGMAQTINNLGLAYQSKGEWDQAISYYEQSLQTKEQVGDIHGTAQTINNLGLAYQSKGEWDKAIFYYEQSLQTMEQVDDIHGMAHTTNNLGNAYQSKGEWDKAISYYEQSLQTMEQVGDIHRVAQTTYNLGNTYQSKGEWDKAISYYEQSLRTMEQVGDIHRVAHTTNNLGNAYQIKGEWDKAISYYEQSLQMKEQVGDIHGMATTYGNLGVLYHSQGEPERANEYMAQAYLIFARLGAAAEAQHTGRILVQFLGSPEAAQAFLQQMAGDGVTSELPPQQNQGVTLEQLLELVLQARQGDREMGKQLLPFLQEMSADAQHPAEVQTLAGVLVKVLAGENGPDLAGLPDELAKKVKEMLGRGGVTTTDSGI